MNQQNLNYDQVMEYYGQDLSSQPITQGRLGPKVVKMVVIAFSVGVVATIVVIGIHTISNRIVSSQLMTLKELEEEKKKLEDKKKENNKS